MEIVGKSSCPKLLIQTQNMGLKSLYFWKIYVKNWSFKHPSSQLLNVCQNSVGKVQRLLEYCSFLPTFWDPKCCWLHVHVLLTLSFTFPRCIWGVRLQINRSSTSFCTTPYVYVVMGGPKQTQLVLDAVEMHTRYSFCTIILAANNTLRQLAPRHMS